MHGVSCHSEVKLPVLIYVKVENTTIGQIDSLVTNAPSERQKLLRIAK